MDLKKATLLSLLVGLNSFVLGANKNMSNSKTSQPTQSTQQMAPSLGDKPAPYNNPNRYMMDLTFIYWQAYMDGLEYGISEDVNSYLEGIILPTTIQPFNDPQTGTNFTSAYLDDRKMSFHWDPGFKLAIGTIFGERDQWDLILNWTWIQNKAKGNFNGDTSFTQDLTSILDERLPLIFMIPPASDPKVITPSWGPALLGGQAANATSNWRMIYNTLDLELGRNFFLEDNITLRPHIGVRAASIHQHVNARYYSILNIADYTLFGDPVPASAFSTYSPYNNFKGRNHFDGVGLRGGLDVNWNFVEHFDVYGKLSSALLYGRFSVNEKFKSLAIITSADEGLLDEPNFVFSDGNDVTINDNYHAIRATLQAALGLTWHTDFNDDKQHLFVSVGYEFNEWFDQNELRQFNLDTPTDLFNIPFVNDDGFLEYSATFSEVQANTTKRGGNLGLQGLTFDVRFDF